MADSAISQKSDRKTSRLFKKVDFESAMLLEETKIPYCTIQYEQELYIGIEFYISNNGAPSPQCNQLVIRGDLDDVCRLVPAFMPSSGNLKYTVLTPSYIANTDITLEVG
jgi:hypothetical protein